MRIHTVTLNPAIDETVTLDRLVPGEVHRAHAVRQNPGGKGVNVASCLADWNLDVVAHGLLGSDNAAPFDQLFARKAIEDRFIRVVGATRVNLKLVDRTGTTDINLTGIAVDESRVDMVVATLGAAVRPGDLVILSGSVPPGCSHGIYAMLVTRLRDAGCRVLLDTSGIPLERALAADVLPHVIKPNRDELAAWAGHPLTDRAELIGTARRLLDRGVELVVVSMGAEGALFLSAEGTVATRLVLGAVSSTVGAGDAMVAGIAAALHERADPERLARLATAFAGGKLGMAGPNLPERGAVEALAAEVSVSEPEAA
ncbi:1-phosphofructokinase [Sphingomonas sp. VNH70]|uniref:1-phosphofructokinase n=1 Tax=Sphingomonas silueang TaxID=3156617 RepID=UPI0032B37E42